MEFEVKARKMLERDFNIPPLDLLMQEVAVIRRLQADASAARGAATEA